jgi:hypothetical protein
MPDESDAPAPERGWAVDKHIPVATLVVAAAQVLVLVWYAAHVDARVDEQDTRITRLEIADRDADVRTRTMADALSRLAGTMDEVRDTMRELRFAIRGTAPIPQQRAPQGGQP